MQMLSFVCFTILAASASSSEVSPMGKVIQMVSDLQSKVIAEGAESQKIYDEFAEWCEDRQKDLSFEIKTGKADSEELTAAAASETSRIEALGGKVEELAAAISQDEADLQAATSVREKEHADFVAEEKELVEISDMLERAIAVLEREMQKSGAAMIQTKDVNKLVPILSTMVQASGFSASDASKLAALVQSSQDDSDGDLGAPDAAAYQGQSGNIIDTLQGLLEKAQQQLSDSRNKEQSAKHNFEMLRQSLTDSIKFGNKDMAEAKQNSAAATERRAAATGDLEVTQKDLQEDETALRKLHHNCMTKAQDFEAEAKSRDEELNALAQAKKILQETSSGATEQTYSLFQTSSSGLRSSADLANFEVVRFIRDLSRKQDAPALTQLASRIASVVRLSTGSNEDVFAKVKGLISDMINRLEDEAAGDASHKAYCDKEMGETREKQNDKTAEIEKLSTKVDKMSSRSAKLKDEVATLQRELAQLSSSQSKMDKVRGEEKALFTKNRAEMQQGLEGVKLALQVLRDYYAKGDAAHGAAEGAGSSIISLLEVCESDFSKGLAELSASEDSSQGEYDMQTKENEVERSAKEQDVKYKSKEATSLDKAVGDATSDRAGVQAELDAVDDYMGKLKSECVEVAETYSERKARREAEISGLKQALEILSSETALLQRSVKGRFTRR